MRDFRRENFSFVEKGDGREEGRREGLPFRTISHDIE